MDKNNVFNTYIAIDPSIWWNEEMMKIKLILFPQHHYIKNYTSLPPIKERAIMKETKKDMTIFMLLLQRNLINL